MTDLLTARVVAQRLGLSTETVLVWVRKGKLPAFKLPSGAIRIRETELESWLQARATTTRGSCQPPTAVATRTASISRVNRLPSEEVDA